VENSVGVFYPYGVDWFVPILRFFQGQGQIVIHVGIVIPHARDRIKGVRIVVCEKDVSISLLVDGRLTQDARPLKRNTPLESSFFRIDANGPVVTISNSDLKIVS